MTVSFRARLSGGNGVIRTRLPEVEMVVTFSRPLAKELTKRGQTSTSHVGSLKGVLLSELLQAIRSGKLDELRQGGGKVIYLIRRLGALTAEPERPFIAPPADACRTGATAVFPSIREI